mgnify:CR=1 FL=1
MCKGNNKKLIDRYPFQQLIFFEKPSGTKNRSRKRFRGDFHIKAEFCPQVATEISEHGHPTGQGDASVDDIRR